MAPSRRASNGRSPLVNQQHQITSFFSKTTSSPSPSPSPLLPKSDIKPKLNPNPNSNPNPCPTSCLDPTTPSPPQSKPKKPLLVICPSPSPVSTPAPESLKKSYGPEAVDKRIRVYWRLDKAWYEGCVKSFDRISGKHLVQYDDADEELLNLAEEKIEWVVEPAKKFRRLRRISMEVDEEEEKEEKLQSGGDDSQDEDWGKNVEKEVAEDVSEDMDLDDEEDDGVKNTKKQIVEQKSKARKRKTSEEVGTLGFSKKSKTAGDLNKGVSKFTLDVNGGKILEPKTCNGSK